MTHKVNQVGPLDFGNVIERHRQEGRIHAYGNMIETLKALQLDGHEMDMGQVIAAIEMIKNKEVS